MERIVIRTAVLYGALISLAACNADTPPGPEPVSGNPDAWPALTTPVERDPAIEARIDDLLAGMSTEEKVGQLIQGEIKYVTPQDVRDYHLGSILNGLSLIHI